MTLKVSDQKTVHSAFLHFPGLPYELGLSPHREEVLAVKIESEIGQPPAFVPQATALQGALGGRPGGKAGQMLVFVLLSKIQEEPQ